ncbi:hypothetical protein MAPG_07674 [Magnaporthiopsis poae ATCC 64411]|uniref:Uncharacterized protein n=1 Tax=Magnaporthiopsis poae (strain ATCC 64411 / 73-15) TaxID=644358 RepID=A0A0C4E5A8_MAGP6|nr:hypothetical protein MAPG_07674 [Magnaporthiopsis poae ATCC 64411]
MRDEPKAADRTPTLQHPLPTGLLDLSENLHVWVNAPPNLSGQRLAGVVFPDSLGQYRPRHHGDGLPGKKYAVRGLVFQKASEPPAVEKCDTATSGVYYAGELLSNAFDNTTRAWTNSCLTAQEGNAVLEVLVKMHIVKMLDFRRVIAMRTGSNPDRPSPGVTPFEHLRVLHQNGFAIAIANMWPPVESSSSSIMCYDEPE